MQKILTCLIVLGLIASSCSSGEKGSPSAPRLAPDAKSTGSSHVLWGLYEVILTKNGAMNIEVEAAALRTAEFNCNVQRFLSPPYSPTNLLTFQILDSSNIPAGFIDLIVGIRHPFPGLNFYRGFDVRGIFMADASTHGIFDPAIIFAARPPAGGPATDAYMLNPDGFTRWWNFPEFTDPVKLFSFKPGALGNDPNPLATLNPYKYFADDLGPEDSVADLIIKNRGSFSPSTEIKKRRYQIQFPVTTKPQIKFNYAIDASWNAPDQSGAPDYPVDSFPAGAQMQEAYFVSVSDGGSDLYYTPSGNGGNLRLNIEIFDWQAKSNSLGVGGEVSSIWLEGVPLSAPVNVKPLAIFKPGSAVTSSVISVELNSSYMNLQSSGIFYLLGTVESTHPDDYMPQLPGGENFIYPTDAKLASYFMAKIEVSDELPQIVVISPNGGEVWQVNSSQEIKWNGSPLVETVAIEYSKDDFVADIHVITDGTPNTGSYLLDSVPNDVSNTVKVRVKDADNSSISDESDSYFSIVSSGLMEAIVYAADGPAQGRHIYSIDPNGLTAPKQWSFIPAILNESPKLSPDGKYILYTSLKSDFSCDIVLIDVATGTETDITPEGYDAIYGDFSHDGKKIVTAMGKFGYPLDLWTLNYDGSNAKQISNGLDVWAPEYNFNDTKIYYMNFGDAQVYIFDVATGQVEQYTNNGTWNDDPHGSPDGTQIAWATAYNNGGRHIYISPINSWYPPDVVINFEQYIRSPCFSPDGKKVAFDHGGFSGSELGIYVIATGTYYDITSNSWGDYMADWGYMIPY